MEIRDLFMEEVTAFGTFLVHDLWYKYAQMLACAFREGGSMNLQVKTILILAGMIRLNSV